MNKLYKIILKNDIKINNKIFLKNTSIFVEKIVSKSLTVDLVHASPKKLSIIKWDNTKKGAYYFEKESSYPYEYFNNIFSIDDVENAEKKYHENLTYLPFYYGNYIHVINNVRLNKVLDLYNFNNFLEFIKENINFFKDASFNLDNENDIEDLYYDGWYNYPKFQIQLNTLVKKLGYDALIMKDNTEGEEHKSYILYKDLKVKE